jgi:Brp/Blh family beta-carotene 15,15'-monooxygenase
MWILVPALALVSLHHLVAAARHRSLRQLLAFGEIIALSLLFALVPPILSFTIYFCFWHSVRHVLRLSSTLDPFDVRRGALGFARHALPLTGVTLAAMAVAWVWLAVPEAALPTTTRVVFQALGALTFPHMIVTALSQTTLE